jgi:nucleotide-binding universal stress UspA family protein
VLCNRDVDQRTEIVDDQFEVDDQGPLTIAAAVPHMVLCIHRRPLLDENPSHVFVASPVLGITMHDHHDPLRLTEGHPMFVEQSCLTHDRRKEALMSNLDHFVVGVDGSTDAEFALQWAVAQEPRRITLVHGFSAGMELLAAGFQINLDPVRAEHDRLLGSAWAAPARDAGIDVDTVLVDDNAADALTYVAKSRGADAIVIGHRGHSRWSTQHVGHIAGHLLHHCEVPLIVTSDTTEAVPLAGTIVVALSRPTDPSNAELVWALDVAERAHTELHLVSLVEPLAYIDAKYSFDMANIHAEMRSQMSDLVSAIRPHHPSIRISTELRDGPAHQKLAAVADHTNASMVVVGSHHPGPYTGFLAGSVARLLPPLLHCPMVAIPSPAHPQDLGRI